MRTVCQGVHSNVLCQSGALSLCFLAKTIWGDCIAMGFLYTADASARRMHYGGRRHRGRVSQDVAGPRKRPSASPSQGCTKWRSGEAKLMVMLSATELAATLWCQELCSNFHLGRINNLLVVVGEIALVLSNKPIPPPKKEEKNIHWWGVWQQPQLGTFQRTEK